MVEHFYQKIPGFFDFQQLYTRAVNEAPEKAHFIKVGVSHGQSAAYLAVEIANSNKEITLDLVDLWGTWNDRSPTPETVKTNLAPIIDLTPINIIQKASVDAAKEHKDLTLDFIFIDASHDYNNVQRDIIKWLPKLKRGGTLAGHDYTHDHPGVKKAVTSLLQNVQIINNSWWYYSN